MNGMKHRVAVVTGGAQGIGEAIATRFACDGARVAIADVNLDKAARTAKSIAADAGAQVIAVACNIAEPESVDAMVTSVENQLGSAEILVNNAGVASFQEPLQTSTDDWNRCMSIDLEGAWLCTKAVLPSMLKNAYGTVINIISNHAFAIIPATFPYPVAKHGLLGLTRALAIEYAGKGITVNAISPGYVDTPIADWYFNQSPDPAAARRETEAKQPPGRLCAPSEVAAVAAMLASDEARFIVGENIVIDGGVTIRMYD